MSEHLTDNSTAINSDNTETINSDMPAIIFLATKRAKIRRPPR